MKRREFITLAGGAAAWPVLGRAQQAKLPVVGLLHSGSPGPAANNIVAFREGLSQSGFIEGKNVAIEYRWAEGQYDRLPALASDLVLRRVDVIAATGTAAPGLAAKAATSMLPIVFQTGFDPVHDGLVTSFNRPGGNVTGVTRMAHELSPKGLELMHLLSPNVRRFAFILNPGAIHADDFISDAQNAARSLGLVEPLVVKIESDRDFDVAFDNISKSDAGALLIATDSYFNSRAERLSSLALRHALPACYSTREFANFGGLMSYGASLTDSYRQVGAYVGRILKGEKPSDLPVLQPTKFELVLNLKTAKILGIEIPPQLLALTDEVIE